MCLSVCLSNRISACLSLPVSLILPQSVLLIVALISTTVDVASMYEVGYRLSRISKSGGQKRPLISDRRVR